MAVKIYVALPVKDLEITRRFFENLGYAFLPKFTDQNTACMVVSDDIRVLFSTRRFFSTFAQAEICDTSTHIETITALRLDTRDEVDAMMRIVLENGGLESEPFQDFGFMYERTFRDLDGHQWAYFWIDEESASSGSSHLFAQSSVAETK